MGWLSDTFGGGDDPKMPVTEYYASVHYGVCHAADEVLEIWYGEKQMWSGNVTVNDSVFIDKERLFGGEKVEGGFKGWVDLMLGASNQTVTPALATGMQRNGASATTDPGQLPGYRGIFTMYIHG